MADIFDYLSSPLGSTIGYGVHLTPQQQAQGQIDYATAIANSPLGQAAQRAQDETVNFNKKLLLDEAKRQRDQIAISQGTARANAWYQKRQIEILQADHALKQQQFETDATGYYNGNPTFAREQAAAQTALRAAELGASLRGPENYPFYLQAMNQVANSPASNLVRSVPGGLGQSDPSYNVSRLTLADVLGQAGMGSSSVAGAGGSGGVSNAQLGLTTQDADTLQNFLRNPNQSPAGWLESKSPTERSYLKGLATFWGHDWDTVLNRYQNSRPNQSSALQA